MTTQENHAAQAPREIDELQERIMYLQERIRMLARSYSASEENNAALFKSLQQRALDCEKLKGQLDKERALSSPAARIETVRIASDAGADAERRETVSYLRDKARRYHEAGEVQSNPYRDLDEKVGLALRMVADTVEEGLHRRSASGEGGGG